jgi:hypothetical protein
MEVWPYRKGYTRYLVDLHHHSRTMPDHLSTPRHTRIWQDSLDTCLHEKRALVTSGAFRPGNCKLFCGLVNSRLIKSQVTYLAFRERSLAKDLDRRMTRHLQPITANPKSTTTTKKSQTVRDTEEELMSYTTNSHRKRQYPWTRVHSHYALMGGFAFNTSDASSSFFPGRQKRMNLSATGLLKLARDEPDLIPDIPETTILDKSKASGLAKTLGCLQATWFLAQTVGRLATDYSISLLEWHTLVHALCCLALYAAWWNKPHDIEEPSLIDASKGSYARDVAAWLIISGDISTKASVFLQKSLMCRVYRDEELRNPRSPNIHAAGVKKRRTQIRDGVSCIFAHEEDYWKNNEAEEKHSKQMEEDNAYNHSLNREEMVDPHADTTQAIYSSDRKDKQRHLKLFSGQICLGFRLLIVNGKHDDYILLSTIDIERLELVQSLRTSTTDDAWRFKRPKGSTERLRDSQKEFSQLYLSLPGTFSNVFRIIKPRKPTSNQEHAQRIGDYNYDKDFVLPHLLWLLVVVGAVYGGFHLLAWNGPFATTTERILWCGSSVALITPLGIIVLCLVVALVAALLGATALLLAFGLGLLVECCCTWPPTPSWMKSLTKPLFYAAIAVAICLAVCLALCCILLVLAYMAARVYLVVECFINLAHLPDDVYLQPQWSKYIPHFGAG